MVKAAASTKALNDELETLATKSKDPLASVVGAEKEVGDQSDETTAKVKKNNQDQGTSASVLSRLLQGHVGDEKTAYESLSAAIDEQKAKIEDLHKAASTNGGNGVQIFGDLKKAKSDLSELENFSEKLTPGFAKAGQDAGSEFSTGFGDGFQAVGKYIIPILIADAVLAAPLIVSIVGAALETGIGGAGIAAGIYEASKDARVKAAAHQLSTLLGGELSSAASVFIGPTLNAIGILRDHLNSIGPGLSKTFGVLAKDVQPLANGLGGAIDKFLPGLESGLKGASPLLIELGNDLPELGKQVGDMFDKFGKGGPGAIMALRGLIGAVGDLATWFGSLYDWSTKTFEEIDQEVVHVANGIGDLLLALGDVPGMGARFTQAGLNIKAFAEQQQNLIDTSKAAATAQGTLGSALDTTGQKAQTAGPDFGALSSQIGQTAITTSTLAGQMTDKLIGGILGADEASNNFNKSLITLGDTLVANGGHLSAHVAQLKKSETGEEQNKDAILAVVQANLQVYDSQIAVGISAKDAAAKYDENTKALEGQLKAAGYTKKQIQDLVGEYKNVPDKVNTEIATEGLTTAINNLDTLLRQLLHLPPLTNAKVNTPGAASANAQLSKIDDQLHGINHYNATAYVHVKVSQSQLNKVNAELHGINGNRWGGVYTHNAAGGLYTHAADGLLSSANMYPPSGAGRYVIAEQQTGGEAFVPRYGNYGRSTDIIDQAARWYGGRFAPNGGYGAGGGGSVYAPQVTNNVYPQRADFTVQDFQNLQVRTEALLRVGRRH
jgi:hypothetical protein